MNTRRPMLDADIVNQLRSAASPPPPAALRRSRARVSDWFTKSAPVIQWGETRSPLGRLFIAVSPQGLCAVDFGRSEVEFLRRLDPRARLQKDRQAVEQVTAQLYEYFSGDRSRFDLPVDLSALTPFQQSVLETARRIGRGEVWTYHRVAREMGRPKSSRPVGQALARNPVPIVIPCHRVVASDGSLGGYSGGSGLEAKRWLLRLEGALS